MHVSATLPRPDLALDASWRRASEACPAEVDTLLPVVEGALPAGLRGTLYRNGPGRMEAGGVPYEHPFDGDGLVLRFHLGPDGVRYTNRFVRTRELLAERRAGKMLYRAFGTNLPGGPLRNLGRMRFKNAANTSVVLHGGRLLALWEGGQPHAIDPVTLHTLGRHDFDGALKNRLRDRWLAPELPFSAHPKLDPVTGELYNFGTVLGAKNRLLLYRVGSDGVMGEIEELPLSPLAFVHDFVFTRRFRVFFLSPVSFRPLAVLLGRVSPADSIDARPGAPTTLLLVPRDGSAPRAWPLLPSFVFHHAGGFEDGRHLLVDSMRLDEYPRLDTLLPKNGAMGMPSPLLTRTIVDLATGRVEEQVLTDYPSELPRSDAAGDGLPHTVVWSVARPPGRPGWQLSGIARHDTEGRTVRFRDFAPDLPSEPIPVLGAAGRWLLTVVYRAATHRSELVLLDADDLSTVCALALPHHVPPGFHGTFVPG